MWQPVSIKIKGLFSHLDTEYHFQKNKCVLIYGSNKSDSDKDSNGSGKSTIMEAIVLAITNQTSRDIGKDDFINEDEDYCFIELELSNKIGKVNNLIIRRTIGRKFATKVELIENGKLNKEMTSVNECNARIYDLIGLTKDDLTRFFLVGQDSNYSFLTASDGDKKNIISRLINMDFINKKIDKLKELSKESSREKNELEKMLVQVETRLETIDEQIMELKDNYKNKKSESIARIEEMINKLKDEKIQIVRKFKQEQENLLNNQLEIKNISFNSSELEKINNEKYEVENHLDLERRKDIKTKQKISKLEATVEGAIRCPKCQTSFILEEERSLDDIKAEIKQLQGQRKSSEKEQNKISTKLDELDQKVQEFLDLENELQSLKRIERKIKNNIADLQESSDSLTIRIEKREKEKIKIKSESIEDKILELEESKREWIESIELIKSDIYEIDKKIEDYDFWIINFGKKGFTTFITNKTIKSIEGITNSYLQKINSNCRIIINGHTVLKSGNVNEKISVDVIEEGHRVGNFLKFSGGEKGRINLCSILGIQSLINLTCPTGGLNLLTLDEVFEGLDRKGQSSIIKVLENMKMTSLVVTHRTEPIGAENELVVEKVNRISRIV